MNFTKLIVTGLVIVLNLNAGSVAAELSNPYEILQKHFEAMGGLERLRAEQSQYMEGTLSVAGLNGTIKIWTRKPHFQRTEVDLKVLKITQGENESGNWVLDANGKLQETTKLDEATLKRRQVKQLLANYEFADPQSKDLTVSFAGVDSVAGLTCYAIKISNRINSDVQTNYINQENFLLEKSVAIEGAESNETIYSDYREIGGLKIAHRVSQVSIATGQEQEIVLSKYESNPQIEGAMFNPPVTKSTDFHFVSGHSSENIPFEFVGNHLFIPVTVAGKQRWWVLDTGAGMTVVDRAFATELGLDLQGDMKGKAVESTVDVQFTVLPPFQIQGIEFDGQTAAVIDMTDLNRLLEYEVSGILGFDFLSRFVTKVDYAAGLVSFYDPASFSYSGSGKRWDIHIGDGTFTTQATLDGVHTGTWLLDLGASHCSLISQKAQKYGYAAKKGVNRQGRGAGKSYTARLVRADSLSFAGFTVKRPTISYALATVDTVAVQDELGALGNTLFRHFVLYVDYAGEHIIVEPGADFEKSFPEDRSGLLVGRTPGRKISVIYVSPGTPAATAGFQEGDIIESLDGSPVDQLGDLMGVRAKLMAGAGTKYTFEVSRSGKTTKLEITLAELY